MFSASLMVSCRSAAAGGFARSIGCLVVEGAT